MKVFGYNQDTFLILKNNKTTWQTRKRTKCLKKKKKVIYQKPSENIMNQSKVQLKLLLEKSATEATLQCFLGKDKIVSHRFLIYKTQDSYQNTKVQRSNQLHLHTKNQTRGPLGGKKIKH